MPRPKTAEMYPGTPAWDRLSRRQQIALRWEWQQETTTDPWYVWHHISHPDGFCVPPDPINLATQLGYFGG